MIAIDGMMSWSPNLSDLTLIIVSLDEAVCVKKEGKCLIDKYLIWGNERKIQNTFEIIPHLGDFKSAYLFRLFSSLKIKTMMDFESTVRLCYVKIVLTKLRSWYLSFYKENPWPCRLLAVVVRFPRNRQFAPS